MYTSDTLFLHTVKLNLLVILFSGNVSVHFKLWRCEKIMKGVFTTDTTKAFHPCVAHPPWLLVTRKCRSLKEFFVKQTAEIMTRLPAGLRMSRHVLPSSGVCSGEKYKPKSYWVVSSSFFSILKYIVNWDDMLWPKIKMQKVKLVVNSMKIYVS